MTEKNHKQPQLIDDFYDDFPLPEDEPHVLRAYDHGATKEEMTTFLNWARKTRIRAALLDLIERRELDICGYKDDGRLVVTVPDNPPPQSPAGWRRRL